MLLSPDDIRKYLHYFPSKVSDSIFFSDKYDIRTLDKPIEVAISKTQYDEAVKKWNLYNVALPECTRLNNKGIEYEKAGDIENAVAAYEQNIGIDKYPATHAYDRLLVLYDRAKDYNNERRVAALATRVFGGQPKYAERLAKIDELIAKSH